MTPDRDHILSNQPEARGEVRVNQRALVRKVLARYSYEFALFRELLQNADDAESESVIIRFETNESSDIVKWILENTGKPFEEADWKRLTEIANGNPDSGKVGAFGVGFYTVFSVTDSPVVFSGGHKMEFYWDDTGPLCFHSSRCSTNKTGVTIEIPLQKPARMPKNNDFLKFLATSITFMAKMRDIRVFLNADCIGHISKSEKTIEPIRIPITLKDADPSKTMTLESLQLHRRPITIQSIHTIDSTPRETTLDLSVYTISADVKMKKDLAEELSRCMVKEQSSGVSYSLIYTDKDEYDQSFLDEQHESIFRGLCADVDKPVSYSTIFIGHSTRQTTGICGHMASQFIPTVERESIDLVDQNIAIWNNGLLHLGGFLSRAIYELELSKIQSTWDAKSKDLTSDLSGLHGRFIHVLKFFTFRPTTPSPKVAEKLCESFYTCTESPLQLLSSVGVRQVSDVRLFDELCETFLKDVPMLSSHCSNLAADFVRAHPDKPEIQSITPSDVENDLRHHPLDGSTGELADFLQWVLHEWTAGTAHLLKVAHFRDADGKDVPLASIQHFIDPKGHGSYIPLKSPLPHSVIPRQSTETILPTMLQQFNWREFTIVDWLRHISSRQVRLANPEYNFSQSIGWAEGVLHSVCSAWSNLKSSGSDVREVAKLVFAGEKCIPTTHGLCIPEQSCLPSSNVTKFDFPIVKFSSSHEIKEEMEQFLLFLGVRKHPPLQLFLAQKGLKTSDVIYHLVQRVSLGDSDTEFLRSSPVFAAKGIQEGSGLRFHLDQLYPPIEIFQQLGLPLIDWGGSADWQDTSRKEVKLLYDLGLRHFPPLVEIIRNLCSKDIKIGEVAFGYLCKHLRSEYSDYNPDEFRDTAFVPAEVAGGIGFRKPGEVFINKQWKILGFPVIQHEYDKSVLELLGIQQHPPSSSILRRLADVENDPHFSEETAYQWFEILSHHIPRFQKNELDCISRLCIVPKTTLGDRKLLTPVECYLGGSTKDDLYSKLSRFVDFGAGDKFLRVCGAKNYPTEDDIATRLVSDPQEVLGLAGWKRFLEELHHLASHPGRIGIEAKCEMTHQSVLLGSRPCEEAGKPETSYGLWKPNEIVIVDDVQTLHQFADSDIVTAPRDLSRELEDFYISLGCQYLTTAVQDQHNASGVIEDQQICSKYRNLVLERLPMFLYNYSHLKPGALGSRFSGANYITVKVWQELSVSRTLTVGKKGTKKKRQVSAIAIYQSNTIQLWLTYQVEENKHDLAASLCRVFLGTENRPDVEFLTTCLGPHDVLEERGYEIDEPYRCLEDWRLLGAVNSPIPVDPAIPSRCVTKETDHDSMTTDKQPTTTNTSPSPSPAGARGITGISLDGTGTTNVPQSHDLVKHQKHMDSTVKAAIRACNRGGQTPLHLESDLNMKKSLENGYCDTSTLVDDLRCLHKIQDVEIHIAKDIPDVDAGHICTQELLTRFLDIIQRIAKIYGLTTKSYRIFYHAAKSIAFNYRGTIYFNLHYFEKWHYENVKKGKEQRALALWFLTFAHEIAHNLVADHNSEHEFWFLAICEAHMEKFSKL